MTPRTPTVINRPPNVNPHSIYSTHYPAPPKIQANIKVSLSAFVATDETIHLRTKLGTHDPRSIQLSTVHDSEGLYRACASVWPEYFGAGTERPFSFVRGRGVVRGLIGVAFLSPESALKVLIEIDRTSDFMCLVQFARSLVQNHVTEMQRKYNIHVSNETKTYIDLELVREGVDILAVSGTATDVLMRTHRDGGHGGVAREIGRREVRVRDWQREDEEMEDEARERRWAAREAGGGGERWRNERVADYDHIQEMYRQEGGDDNDDDDDDLMGVDDDSYESDGRFDLSGDAWAQGYHSEDDDLSLENGEIREVANEDDEMEVDDMNDDDVEDEVQDRDAVAAGSMDEQPLNYFEDDE